MSRKPHETVFAEYTRKFDEKDGNFDIRKDTFVRSLFSNLTKQGYVGGCHQNVLSKGSQSVGIKLTMSFLSAPTATAEGFNPPPGMEEWVKKLIGQVLQTQEPSGKHVEWIENLIVQVLQDQALIKPGPEDSESFDMGEKSKKTEYVSKPKLGEDSKSFDMAEKSKKNEYVNNQKLLWTTEEIDELITTLLRVGYIHKRFEAVEHAFERRRLEGGISKKFGNLCKEVNFAISKNYRLETGKYHVSRGMWSDLLVVVLSVKKFDMQVNSTSEEKRCTAWKSIVSSTKRIVKEAMDRDDWSVLQDGVDKGNCAGGQAAVEVGKSGGAPKSRAKFRSARGRAAGEKEKDGGRSAGEKEKDGGRAGGEKEKDGGRAAGEKEKDGGRAAGDGGRAAGEKEKDGGRVAGEKEKDGRACSW